MAINSYIKKKDIYIYIYLCHGLAKSESLIGVILAVSLNFQRMNSKIPGNTMNTKFFSSSYQLHCIVVFSGKFRLVICQNLSGDNK